MSICSDPYMSGAIPLGCGKCIHCLTNRARLWSWRQYLEYLQCGAAAFVTLTYDERNLPGGRELRPKDVRLWLKRLRKSISPHRIRYFLVGEYGEQSERPHYHASLFGVHWFNTINHLTLWEHVDRSWNRGLVHMGEFNIRTAHYVTGYLSKSLRDKERGRKYAVPEFTRMSTRPGLGAGAASILCRQISGVQSVREGEVPYVLRQEGRLRIPLGRYLHSRIVKELGVEEELGVYKDEASWQKSAALYSLLRADESIPSLKEAYLESIKGRLEKDEAFIKIYRRGVQL